MTWSAAENIARFAYHWPGISIGFNCEKMADYYSNFEELAQNEFIGVDYDVHYASKASNILILAPHGGKIEFFTSTIAALIAGDDFSLYTFRGLKNRGNRILHITSHRFDEPLAVQAVRSAEKIIAIHGAQNSKEELTMVGGLDNNLISCIIEHLKDSGFTVKTPTRKMRALHPGNICNRGKTGKGVQLEISRKLRSELKRDHKKRACFVNAIRKALR